MGDWLARWRLRLGFGVLLLTFGEFIGWQSLTTRAPQDWLVVLVVYVALTGLMLDLIVRWYMLERLNVLLAAGVFGIVHGTLISMNLPRNLPLSIIVFGTATPTLMFLLGYGSFGFLYVGTVSGRWLFAAAPLIGLLYGIWTRWLPQTKTVAFDAPALHEILPYTVLMLAASGLLVFSWKIPSRLERFDWLLTPYEAAVCLAILVVLAVIRTSNLQESTFAFIISGIIVGILLALARFYRTLSPVPVAWSMPLNPSKPLLLQWQAMIVIFGFAAIVGYNLPNPGTDSIQSSLLFGGLLLFGILWPPLVSFFVSMQAFIELGRQEF